MLSKNLLFFFFFFFSSCFHTSDSNIKRASFKKFILKFKPLNYKSTINLDDSLLLKDSKEINQNTPDTSFIKLSDNVRSFGYLKDTSNFFAFIYVVIGDEPEFRLITVNKRLEKINDVSLLNNNIPIYESKCVDVRKKIQIENTNLIRSITTISYFKCDSNDNLIKGNIISKKISQTIIIDLNGFISKTNL